MIHYDTLSVEVENMSVTTLCVNHEWYLLNSEVIENCVFVLITAKYMRRQTSDVNDNSECISGYDVEVDSQR